MSRSLLSGTVNADEKPLEERLRPTALSDYAGQEQIKNQLHVFLEAAKSRSEPLDHLLLYGPPGLGKTTLAHVVAHELGMNVKVTSGPAIERPIDLLIVLKSLKTNDVLFVDEIHRLKRPVEEILYPAMEDFVFHRVIQRGLVGSAATVPLPRFTLIGATTRPGFLAPPLRDRFGILFRLDFYAPKELHQILRRSARILSVESDDDGLFEIASRSRGTPRIANRLLRRVRDFATVKGNGTITREVAQASLGALNVDLLGLDDVDRRYLELLIVKFGGGPVGLETLAGSLGEDAETLEEMCEPYLLQQGFLNRTPRGRMASEAALRHFKTMPMNSMAAWESL